MRNRALLVYGGIGAGGFTLGMVAGGLLTTVGWRWVFFAPVLLASLLLVLAHRFLTEGAAVPVSGGRSFDAAGAATMTGGMLLIVLGVVRAPDVAGVLTAATLAAGALLLAAFVASSGGRPHRWCGSASCVPRRWCGPTWARCCSSARSSRSSSSSCCTCRSCGAGRRSRRGWRC